MRKAQSGKIRRIISFVVTIAMMLGIFAVPVEQVEATGLAPFQQIVLDVMDLNVGDRTEFVEQVLGVATTQEAVTPQLVNSVRAGFLPNMSASDIEAALVEYSKLSDTAKTILSSAVNSGLPASLANIDGFPGISSLINQKITGNTADGRGLKFLYKLLYPVVLFTGTPIARNGNPGTDAGLLPTKIKFNLTGYASIKSAISQLIEPMASLKAEIISYPGATNFDKLLNYCEQSVNTFSDAEIAEFKAFLKDNGTIFGGDIYYAPAAPTITNVTSGSTNGNYNTSQFVTINVQFSEDVDVTGFPTLELNANNGIAQYTAGTGSNMLSFRYTIYEGESTESLDYTSQNALRIDGASIKNAGQVNANLQLPTPGGPGSLAYNSNISINYTPPEPDYSQLPTITANFDDLNRHNSYIEFKTNDANIYSGVKTIQVQASGEFGATLPIRDGTEVGAELLTPQNFMLQEVGAGGFQIQAVEGNIRFQGPDKVNITLRVNEETLLQNKTYRIIIQNDFLNSILSSVMKAIKLPAGNPYNNFAVRLRNEQAPEGQREIGRGETQWNSGASATINVRELVGSDSVVIYGNNQEISYNYDFTGTYSNVNKVAPYLLKDSLTNTLQASYNAPNATWGGSAVAVASVGGIYSAGGYPSLKMDIALNAPETLNSIKTLRIAGQAGSGIAPLIRNIIQPPQGQQASGAVYMVALNNNNNVIGWKKVENLTTELITNPTFVLPDNQTDYQGLTNPPASPILVSLNEAGVDASNVIVTGTTEYTVGGAPTTKTFYLQLQQGMNPGNFSRQISFVNQMDLNRYAISESELSGMGAKPGDGIPVEPYATSCTITLTYTYLNAQSQEVDKEKVLTWTPAAGDVQGFWNWARTDKEMWRIGPNSIIDVRIGNLNPNVVVSNMKLIAKNNLLQTIAEFLPVSTPISVNGEVKVYRFQPNPSLNNLGSAPDNNPVILTLKHDNGVNEPQETGIASPQTDKTPPNGNSIMVEYLGAGSGDYEGLYGVKINADEMYISQLNAGKGTYFNLKDPSGRSIGAPTSIAPFDPPSEDPNNNNPPERPYHQVVLYYPNTILPWSTLTLTAIPDSAGNIMEAPVTKQVRMHRQVTGMIRNIARDPMPNANIVMVNPDFIAEDIANKQLFEKEGKAVVRLNANGSGQFEGDVMPGEYIVFRIAEGDYPEAPVYKLAQEVTIPFSTGNTPYEFNVQLQAPNVTGAFVPEAIDPDPKTTVVIIPQEYTTGTWATMEDQMAVVEFFGQAAKANQAGAFGLYLAPGTYKVLGKQADKNIVPPVNDVVFTVETVGEETTTTNLQGDLGHIIFPRNNVIGYILDSQSNPIPNAMVVIRKVGSVEKPTMARTNEQGRFRAAASQGSYAIDSIMVESMKGTMEQSRNGGLFMMDARFNVNSDLALQNYAGANQTYNTGASRWELRPPNKNVEIKLVMSDSPITEPGSINLKWGSQPEQHELWFGTQTGIFDLYLQAGSYNIASANAGMTVIDDLNQAFTVGGTPLLGGNAVVVDFASNSNVIIQLKDDQATPQPIANAGIAIDSMTGYEHYWRNTDSQGKVYLNLEPGEYRIPGYQDGTAWTQFDYKFTVTADESKWPVMVTIQKQTPNVSGTVTGVSNAWMNIKKLRGEGEMYDQFFGTNVNESGAFAITLGEGDYVIEGVGTMSGWQELNFKFSIGSDNKVYVGGVLRTTLVVAKPADNIFGHVYKTGTTPFTGTRVGATGTQGTDVWLVLQEAGVAPEAFNLMPWFYEKWVPISEEDGSFGTIVDTDKKYLPRAIVVAGRWMEINKDAVSPADAIHQATGAIIPSSSRELTIIPPAGNFSGRIQNFLGQNLGRGWLNIEKVDVSGNPVPMGWRGMDIDENGEFSTALEVGSRYIIREATIFNEDSADQWKEGTRYVFNQIVTIVAAEYSSVTGTGTQNMTLKPNVKGSINLGSTIDMQGQNHMLNVMIRPAVETEQMRQEPWKYEKQASISYDEGTSSYIFYTYLPAGNYKLAGIPAPGKWIELNETFSMSSNDVTAGKTLSFNSTPNVTGYVRAGSGAETGIANVWLNFEKFDSASQTNMPGTWDPNKFFGSNTNNSGFFSLKLSDSPVNGFYRLNGYSTQGQWANKVWQPGKWVQVNYTFKVVGGLLKNMNGQPLSQIIIASNVNGKVMKIYNSSKDSSSDFISTTEGQYSQIKDAWISIKPYKLDGNQYVLDYSDWSNSINTNMANSGEFSLMLPEGKYRVLDVGGRNFWMKLDLDFEVNGAGNLVQLVAGSVEGTAPNQMLILKSQRPNFTGIAYRDTAMTQTMNWGSIAVKPSTAKEFDWSQVVWLNTKDDGSFEGNLGVGDWKITEINGAGMWVRVNIPINVALNGSQYVITSPVNGVVQGNGTIKLAPRAPNVRGSIKYNNMQQGGQLSTATQDAWITIKPANAMGDDWSNAIGVEYRDKDGDGTYTFETRLEEGSYKIANVGGPGFWYEPDLRFNVNSSGEMVEVVSGSIVGGYLVVTPPTPNLQGTAYQGSNTQSAVISKGWIGFARFDATGTQLTFDGNAITEQNSGWKAPQEEIYWRHTRHSEINDPGEFSMRLSDGYYKVVSVNGPGVFYNPGTQFTILSGQMMNSSGAVIENLDVTMPGPNMTITVKGSSAGDSIGWVDIKDTSNGAIFPVQGTRQGNGDYVIEARLKNGPHTVVGFGTPTTWTQVDIDNFTIPTVSTLEINFAQQTRQNISGIVYQTGSTRVSQKAWLSIQKITAGSLTGEKKWIQTDEDGDFIYKLPLGETWGIVDVTTSSGYKEYIAPTTDNDKVVGTTADNDINKWNIDLSSNRLVDAVQ